MKYNSALISDCMNQFETVRREKAKLSEMIREVIRMNYDIESVAWLIKPLRDMTDANEQYADVIESLGNCFEG